MVSGFSIAAMIFTMVVPILFLVVLLILLFKRCKTGWKPVLIGAGIFLVFALLLEGLFNRFLLVWNGTTSQFFKNNVLAYCLIGGIDAGIFEETGRLFGFRMFFKGRHEWKYGIAYGLGHGGIELLLLIGPAYLNNIFYAVQINNGTFDQLKERAAGHSAEFDAIKNALIQTPSTTFLSTGVERIMALILQIALSLLVLYAVANRRYLFYALAVAIHVLTDFSTAYLARILPNIWLTEGVLLLIAVASVIFIVKSRRMFEKNVTYTAEKQER